MSKVQITCYVTVLQGDQLSPEYRWVFNNVEIPFRGHRGLDVALGRRISVEE